jgi:hypothetical protein
MLYKDLIMRFKSKEEIAEIKQQILDYCKDFKKTGEIARALNIECSYINNYAYDLWQNGSFVERIPEKTSTNTRTWAYKTVIPVYKDLGKSPTAIEEAKWNYIHVPLFGYQPIETNVQGKTYKITDEEREKVLKDAEEKRRKERKNISSSRVYVSGSTLHMAV